MTEHELADVCQQHGVTPRWATRRGTNQMYLYVNRRVGKRTHDAYICSDRRFEELTRRELLTKISRLPRKPEGQRLEASEPDIRQFIIDCLGVDPDSLEVAG